MHLKRVPTELILLNKKYESESKFEFKIMQIFTIPDLCFTELKNLPWCPVLVCAASLLHFGGQSGHGAVGVGRGGRRQKVPSHLGRCGADFELTLSVQSTPTSARRRRLKRRLCSLRSARADILESDASLIIFAIKVTRVCLV